MNKFSNGDLVIFNPPWNHHLKGQIFEVFDCDQSGLHSPNNGAIKYWLGVIYPNGEGKGYININYFKLVYTI